MTLDLPLLVIAEREERTDARGRGARPRRAWKLQRQVSRLQFTELRDSGTLDKWAQAFSDALTAYLNRFNDPPTLKELTRWAFEDGRIPADDPNLFRPRCTELGPGKRRRQRDGSYTVVGGGQIEYLPVRRCRITQRKAHPIRPREAGSAEVR